MGTKQRLQPCSDGEHCMVWDGDDVEVICAGCGLSASAIIDRLGHSVRGRSS